jgi:hypothetical protein
MNQVQRQLVWSGAIVAALLGAAAARELSKPGLNCKDQLETFTGRDGRRLMVKARACE